MTQRYSFRDVLKTLAIARNAVKYELKASLINIRGISYTLDSLDKFTVISIIFLHSYFQATLIIISTFI